MIETYMLSCRWGESIQPPLLWTNLECVQTTEILSMLYLTSIHSLDSSSNYARYSNCGADFLRCTQSDIGHSSKFTKQIMCIQCTPHDIIFLHRRQSSALQLTFRSLVSWVAVTRFCGSVFSFNILWTWTRWASWDKFFDPKFAGSQSNLQIAQVTQISQAVRTGKCQKGAFHFIARATVGIEISQTRDDEKSHANVKDKDLLFCNLQFCL